MQRPVGASRLIEQPIVVATRNAGKLREFAAILSKAGRTVISAAELGLCEPEETGNTLEENALIKARSAAELTGRLAISDDSGLFVDALGGDPGVHSADWSETPQGRNFDVAMERVWRSLEAVRAKEPIAARFRTVICLADPSGNLEYFQGSVDGTLVWPKRGLRGFGYDPIFVPEGCERTFGEMDAAEKNAISHRSRALEQFAKACLDR